MQEARRRPTRRNPRWVHAAGRAARPSPRTSGLKGLLNEMRQAEDTIRATEDRIRNSEKEANQLVAPARPPERRHGSPAQTPSLHPLRPMKSAQHSGADFTTRVSQYFAGPV